MALLLGTERALGVDEVQCERGFEWSFVIIWSLQTSITLLSLVHAVSVSKLLPLVTILKPSNKEGLLPVFLFPAPPPFTPLTFLFPALAPPTQQLATYKSLALLVRPAGLSSLLITAPTCSQPTHTSFSFAQTPNSSFLVPSLFR